MRNEADNLEGKAMGKEEMKYYRLEYNVGDAGFEKMLHEEILEEKDKDDPREILAGYTDWPVTECPANNGVWFAENPRVKWNPRASDSWSLEEIRKEDYVRDLGEEAWPPSPEIFREAE